MNNEINNEQILRDFLVYSYFGIVPERIYDKNLSKNCPPMTTIHIV